MNNNSDYINVSDDENDNNDDDSSNIKNNNDNYQNNCIKLNNERRSNSDSIDDLYHVDIWRDSSLVRICASDIFLYPKFRS